MVSIRCLAYNHEPFIRQCLEGFVMQKTNFRFEAIVHDDASTDGTAAIIREYAEKYPGIIKPIFETENQYSKHDGSLGRIMDAEMRGKYIAMCEGDDYWIDQYKLQKQVDFLENHEAYAMCVNATKWQYSDGAITRERGCQYITDTDISTDEIIRNGGLFLNTASYMYRASRIRKDEYAWWKMADVGDYPLCIAASLIGKVRFLSDEMSVYRFQLPGSWTGNQKGTVDLKHLQNEMTWLKCLDEETNGKYREAIYTHLFPGMIRGLYKYGCYDTAGYFKAYRYADVNISKVRIMKDVIIHFFPFLKHR